VATVSVRYIVDDVDAAIEFYCGNLGFEEVMHPAPAFAMLSRGDLRLVLSAPAGGPGGGQAMPDGTLPAPGGWNRFQLEDPSGNPVELFEPTLPEASLSSSR
jgi:catechol 2,3-dioxygenase-like lactoylglutathione lyase family enzyme